MKINNIMVSIIGMMICAIMVSSAFLPSVASALVISGDPVTYYNDDYYTFREVQNGDELVIERYLIDGEQAVKISLNGDDIPINKVYTPIVVSDGIMANIYPTSNTSTISYRFVKENSTNESHFWGAIDEGTVTIAFDDGTFTFTLMDADYPTPQVFTVTCDWGYIACPVDDSSHIASAVSGNAYVRNGTIPILCAPITTPATMIYQNNTGDFGISNPDVTGAPIYTYSKVEGTTDVYTLNVKVNLTLDGVTTESDAGVFLVPYKVDGHTDSGAIYSLIAVLPIVAVAGLVMAGIYVFISRK